MGMLEFQVLLSFLLHRLQWQKNFSLLASRLDSSTSGLKPPLWFDVYALQMMFYQLEHPVYFAPVYGCVLKKPDELYWAYPQVPTLLRVMSFKALRDFEQMDIPASLPWFLFSPWTPQRLDYFLTWLARILISISARSLPTLIPNWTRML